MKKTIENINETKCWSFEKINKINKPLARLITKKRSQIKSEMKEVTIDTTEIEKIKREYYEQLHTWTTQEKVNKFLKIRYSV